MYSKGKLFLKFLKYWVKASSRKGHGVHSPFVFDFIIHVLNARSNEINTIEINIPSFGKKISLKYIKLINRISTYYIGYTTYVYDLFAIVNEDFSNCGKMFDTISEKDIYIVAGIRSSENAENNWAEIKKNEKVTCSIDLFFIGILFFKKDFKEKLDFMIRF